MEVLEALMFLDIHYTCLYEWWRKTL